MALSTDAIWIVELAVGPQRQPLAIKVERPMTLGRPGVREMTDDYLDLTSYGGENSGVSRQHIRLVPGPQGLSILDMGSGNGTYLNGDRLEANRLYDVKQGDQLILGHLPVDIVHVVARPRSVPDGSTEPTPAAGVGGRGELVLVVEDDNDVAQLLTTMLKRAGYQTAISRDVLGAIRVFNQRHPSAVILDLMLPDVYGLEFCRYVRRDANYSHTPIVVLSAARTPENLTNAVQAGADTFLDKPVNSRELIETIAMLVSQKETGVDVLNTKVLGQPLFPTMAPERKQDTVVLFVTGHAEMPMTVSLRQPVSFGRSSGGGSNKAHIDLSRFDAADLGVSRIHMTLSQEDGVFRVEDAGSANGTFLNGNPLKPNEPTPFNSGAEIRAGQLRMYAYFLAESEDGG